MIKHLIITLCLVIIPGMYSRCEIAPGIGTFRDYVPEPRLISPVSEEIDLAGAKVLSFVWSPHEGRNDIYMYYDFRLYRGREMYQATLLLKKQVASTEHEVGIDAGIFDDGGIYTWSVRRVAGPAKSAKSFYSFVVRK